MKEMAPRLPMVPRLLPIALGVMLALAGLKATGLAQRALAETATQPHAPGAIRTAPSPPAPTQPQPQVFTPPAAAPPGAAPASEAERAILLDLRKRRGELDVREAALVARENVLAAAEKRLSERVTELTSLQARLESLESSRRARDEEGWRGLVKLYEAMKPREAATIFNDLDRPVLVGVLDRMKEAKAALILAAMQPERARQVTAELVRRRAEANRPAAALSAPGG
jgi:flagellar motility protein MotE (MotC chaperone)